ncbi:MAG TPA: M24 family metallopeptidase [Chloroflexota bacterium]|nr:M24 family metallopeptidase [Chloroflexota bacterium]
MQDEVGEISEKHARLEALRQAHHLDAILLTRTDNIAWSTGGARGHIVVSQDTGVCSILSDAQGFRLLTNNIEEGRILAEELPPGTWRPVALPWYAESVDEALRRAEVSRVGADSHIHGTVFLGPAIAELRTPLLPVEMERYRALGRDTGEALEHAARLVRVGDSEYQIVARVAAGLIDRGIDPVVLLAAVDERIRRVRHPLPTALRVNERAMLVCCGRRHGLIASVTRIVHLGTLPDQWRLRQESCARVDAAYLGATVPGATAGQIFAKAAAAYAAEGYPGEWEFHHQGGAAGYGPRDWLGTPTATQVVQVNQGFAWNPSIAGTKVEDTVLLTDSGIEVITASGDWPMLEVQSEGQRFSRPGILELATSA